MIVLTELLCSLFPAVLIKSVKESESLFIRNPYTPRRGLQALSLKLKLKSVFFVNFETFGNYYFSLI